MTVIVDFWVKKDSSGLPEGHFEPEMSEMANNDEMTVIVDSMTGKDSQGLLGRPL